jgi:hypothetical protein
MAGLEEAWNGLSASSACRGVRPIRSLTDSAGGFSPGVPLGLGEPRPLKGASPKGESAAGAARGEIAVAPYAKIQRGPQRRVPRTAKERSAGPATQSELRSSIECATKRAGRQQALRMRVGKPFRGTRDLLEGGPDAMQRLASIYFDIPTLRPEPSGPMPLLFYALGSPRRFVSFSIRTLWAFSA